jgi:hypothetical protein
MNQLPPALLIWLVVARVVLLALSSWVLALVLTIVPIPLLSLILALSGLLRLTEKFR